MERSEDLSIPTLRLILRDFVEADLADVHAFSSDPEVARFMEFAPRSPEESAAWLRDVIVHNQERPRVAYNLAIVLREEARVTGWIGIGASERYATPGELGFGYALHRDYWNQGYATEAVRAIVRFAFGTLAGQRISAWCWAENRASARVLEKAGLRLVRLFELTEPKSDRVLPCQEYAIRRDEW
jgi:[ribosomal protein S5]-alanine N-acetyltransferase